MGKIGIMLESGNQLICELNDDPNYKELMVYIADKKGGVLQDLVIVGECYGYDENLTTVPIEGKYSIKVYEDPNNEDWTKEFIVDEWKHEDPSF